MTATLQMSLFSPRWEVPPARAAAPYVDPFLAYHADRLTEAGAEPLTFDEATWDTRRNSAVGMDVEVFRNFVVVCFKRFLDGKRLAFEKSDRSELNSSAIKEIILNNTIVTFNGNAYDLPILFLAINGRSCSELKTTSDKIIFGNHNPRQIEEVLGVKIPRLNHIDLIETNPSVRQGLKMLAGRLHARFMVDLPFEPEAILTPKQMNIVTLYCHNDIDNTELVYKALREPLELRAQLGKQYGIDFRSRSDSQIGESIVRRRIEKIVGQRIARQAAPAAPSFQYQVPDFISFREPYLSRVLEKIAEAKFTVSSSGKVVSPKFLETLKIPLGESVYTMGIGGLHSTEAHRAIIADNETMVLDVDVASQYPNIIMKLGVYPSAAGPAFLKVYGELIRDRLAAKAAGDKVRADGGRIALNGVFGKLGSPYSFLYSPNLLIATTLTGQLAVLMLIEEAEAAGISVVSANTDGVVFRCFRKAEESLNRLLHEWEVRTGFSTERAPYRALYNSSVNTYVAVKEDGKVKRKGYIADPWREGDLRGQMMKNPQMTICSEAVVRYIVDGIPIDRTVSECIDPKSFVTVIKVSTGALWRGHALGRAVRYYWSVDGDQIMYSDGSRRVSKTEGARPLQELTETLPPDLDRLRYCEEAVKLASDLGVSF